MRVSAFQTIYPAADSCRVVVNQDQRRITIPFDMISGWDGVLNIIGEKFKPIVEPPGVKQGRLVIQKLLDVLSQVTRKRRAYVAVTSSRRMDRTCPPDRRHGTLASATVSGTVTGSGNGSSFISAAHARQKARIWNSSLTPGFRAIPREISE